VLGVVTEDPRQRFMLRGVVYMLDADPCTPRLWRVNHDGSRTEVAAFSQSWHPARVLQAAREDRDRLDGNEGGMSGASGTTRTVPETL
jgi:hypothetical protein